MSSEGEKRTEEAGSLVSGDDDAVDTGEGVEEPGSDIVEDDAEEESREAEASPSSNTRQRTMAAAAAATTATANGNRGTPLRRSARSPFRARGVRPTPIVWESQSGRGDYILNLFILYNNIFSYVFVTYLLFLFFFLSQDKILCVDIQQEERIMKVGEVEVPEDVDRCVVSIHTRAFNFTI